MDARGCTLVVCAANRVRVPLRLSMTSRAMDGLAIVRRGNMPGEREESMRGGMVSSQVHSGSYSCVKCRRAHKGASR